MNSRAALELDLHGWEEEKKTQTHTQKNHFLGYTKPQSREPNSTSQSREPNKFHVPEQGTKNIPNPIAGNQKNPHSRAENQTNSTSQSSKVLPAGSSEQTQNPERFCTCPTATPVLYLIPPWGTHRPQIPVEEVKNPNLFMQFAASKVYLKPGF